MSESKVSLAVMEAEAGLQAGAYGEAFWFRILMNFLESRFPGAGAFIAQVAVLLPWSKLWAAIQAALADYQEGKNFLQILQEALKEWLEIDRPDSGPIRMTAK